jgi:hypothetical protein
MKHRLANLTGGLAQSGRKETPAFGEHLSRIISESIQGRKCPGGRFVRRGHGCWGVSKSSIAVKNLFTLAKGRTEDRSIERTGRLDSEEDQLA